MAATELATAYLTLIPSMRGSQGAIAKELGGIDTTGTGRTMGNKMGTGLIGSLKSFIGPAMAIFAGAAIKDFAVNSVAAFSELEDSTAAAGVVFGDYMGQVIAQSKTAGAELGLSEQQVISAANTFGTYGKAAGLGGKELATFSTDFTALAADMASFKGTSPEQAIEAIGAALRGETEPIRAYGVMLDDASLRQEAMKQGIISSTKEALTPQQKTLAAQALIYKQTADAQGDFARTSDSTANVAKTLAAESENLSAKFGGLLAPAFTAVRLVALDMVRGMSGAIDVIGPVMEQVYTRVGQTFTGLKALFTEGDFTADLGAGLGVAEDSPVVGFLFGVRDAVQTTLRGIQAFILGFRFPDLAGLFGGTSLGPIAAMGATVRDVFGQMATVMGPLITQFLGFAGAASPLATIFQALAPMLPGILSLFGQLAATLGGALMSILVQLTPVFMTLQTTLVGLLSGVLSAALPAIASMVGMLASALSSLIPVIVPIITAVVSMAAALIGQLAPILMTLVSAVFPMVVSIFGSVLSAIVPLVQMIAGILIPIIRALLPVVTTVFSVVAAVITSAMRVVQGVIQVVTGLISGNWNRVFAGIANITRGIFGIIGSLISGAMRIIGSVIVAGLNIVRSVWNNVWSFVGTFLAGIWNSIRGHISAGMAVTRSLVTGGINAVRGVWNSVWSSISSFVGNIWSGIRGAVSNGISNVTSVVSGLRGRVLGAVSGAASWLVSTGQNMIQGMVNGVRDMAGNIIQAAKDVVGGAIEGAKNLLGIKSPSRVFYEIGAFTGEGFENALHDATARAQAAMEAMVNPPTAPEFSTRAMFDSWAASAPAPDPVQNVWVQNPWTGEYLLARVDDRADSRINSADRDAGRRRIGV